VIAVCLLAKTGAAGSNSSGGSRGGRAHRPGGYFQSGVADFSYHPPYS